MTWLLQNDLQIISERRVAKAITLAYPVIRRAVWYIFVELFTNTKL